MTDLRLAQDGRARHWLLDAALGGVAALGAITLAHAALPEVPRLVRAPSPAVAPAPAPRAEAPAVLIAFADPVPGREVVSPFGLRRLPWEEGGRLHAGVDISGARGEPVRAAADGVVVEAGRNASYGRYVALRHAEGLTTFYAHLGGVQDRMRPGVAVKAGEPVGRIGSSGISTGPHLHFEIRDPRDRPLNPVLFLGRAFAEADDLPLHKARRVGRTIRIAHVSTIPQSKRLLMARPEGEAEGDPAPAKSEPGSKAPDAASAGTPAAGIEGLKVLEFGPDGRPRARLSL